MPTARKWLHAMPHLLLLALTLTGCGTKSSDTPPVVVDSRPHLPPLPAEITGIEPPPSGVYSREADELFAGWRKQLRSTPGKSGS